MQKNRLLYTLCAAAMTLAAFTGEVEQPPQVLRWARAWNRPDRFDAASPGRCKLPGRGKVVFDDGEKALRFDYHFDGDKEFWAYPRIFFKESESLEYADTLTFEFRAEQGDGSTAYAACFAMFDGNPFYALPAPTREYRKVTIDLREAIKDRKAVRNMAIGMNPTAKDLTFWVRNLEVTGRQPPRPQATAPGPEFKPFPWSHSWNNAARFAVAGCHQTPADGRAVRDEKEQAIRFEYEFLGDKGFWAYPRIFLADSESLENADYLTFEMRAETPPDSDGIDCANVMLGYDNKYCSIPVPDSEYRLYVIDLRQGCKDRKAVRNIGIGMNPLAKKLTYWVKNIRVLGRNIPEPVYDAAEAVSVNAPGTVFTQGEPLDFHLDGFLPAAKIGWKLFDWQGKPLREGEWPAGGKQPLTLAPLADGYYRLTLSSPAVTFTGEKSFVVVPDPAARPDNPDAFFCWDTAQNELAKGNPENTRHPQDGYAEASEISRRCGVRTIRDRFCWTACEKKPGVYDYDRCRENVEALSRRGVKVSNLLYGCPEWTRDPKGILPNDLMSLYNFAKATAKFYDGKVDVWEFWNEEDIWFASESAWDFASAQKAAYLGFKAGSPDTPVAQGAISQMADPSIYTHVMFSNGVRDYMDIFNVHTYAAVCDLPRLGETIKAFTRKYGIHERPLWITENGTKAEGLGREVSYMPCFRRHSGEQELLVAEVLPKTMITMQAAGIDRDFFFLLVPYNEQNGHKDWGLLRRDFSAKPAVAAQSNLLYLLADAELQGELNVGDGLRAYLYRKPDNSQTLVYWSKSLLDTRQWNSDLKFDDLLEKEFRLRASGTPKGYNLFGTPFEVDKSNGALTLHATRMPSYVTGLAGVKADKPCPKRVRKFAPAQVDYDRAIVYQVKLGRNFKMLSYAKDYVELEESSGELELVIWNFSPEVKTGVLKLSGLEVATPPAGVTLQPFAKTVVPLKLTCPKGKSETVFEVNGTFNRLGTSQLRMPVVSREEVARRIAEGRREKLMFTDDPVGWRKNSSGEMQISWDGKEKALKFVADFSKVANGEYWAYPEYVLQLPQDSMRGATGITFEIKATPAADVNLALLMAVYSSEAERDKGFWLDVAPPKEEWESRTVIFKTQNIDGEKIRQIRIGMNPTHGGILTYYVRNIQVIYPR